MEFVYSVLWTLFWPWSILAGLIYFLLLAYAESSNLEDQLKQKDKQIESAGAEVARLVRSRSEGDRIICDLKEQIRTLRAEHKVELEKASHSSLGSLLGLKGGA